MSIAQRLKHIKNQITAACCYYHRDPSEVHLIAVSKNRTSSEIKEAYLAGQRAFAESYVQEALPKIVALKELAIEWHFIGAIQSNKARLIAENFLWVHSVSSYRVAELLSRYRTDQQQALNICLQINISHEQSKAGMLPSELELLASRVVQLPRLQLRGLMVIPASTQDKAQQHHYFQETKLLADQLQQKGIKTSALSMGMSDDYQAAIAEGATLLRIGTAIFGRREKNES